MPYRDKKSLAARACARRAASKYRAKNLELCRERSRLSEAKRRARIREGKDQKAKTNEASS